MLWWLLLGSWMETTQVQYAFYWLDMLFFRRWYISGFLIEPCYEAISQLVCTPGLFSHGVFLTSKVL